MAAEITKYGTTGLKGLRGINQQPADDSSNDILRQVMSRNLNSYLPNNDAGIGIQAAEAGYGESKYDDAVTSVNQFDDLNEVRYAEQPWYDVLANGVGKMLGTAGTTFLSSVVGLPVGLVTAAAEGRWSGIWDNGVTNALSQVDDWMEKNMTNYQSAAQKEDPSFRLGDMNWWADNVIKNVGFTLGAAASMAVGSGSLGLMAKSIGMVNNVSKATKTTANLISSIFSATGEGMIEAKQGTDEWMKPELMRVEDAYNADVAALEQEFNQIEEWYSQNKNQRIIQDAEGHAQDAAFVVYSQKMNELGAKRDEIKNRYEAAKEQVYDNARKMGNKILLGNQVLLAAGNMIQFGKGMTKSFDAARHAAETSSKYAKPFGMRAQLKTGGKPSAENLYEITGNKNLSRLAVGTKGFAIEGSQEMNQQWIQSSAGAAYTEKDVNDYWKAKLNDSSYREATAGLYTLGNILSQGFRDSWGTKDQWEQFLIGGMTGAAGIYMPTKVFNQDKTKSRWDPRRYGDWQGGAINEINAFNDEYSQFEENIDDLNKVLRQEDFFTRMQSMAARTYAENRKAEAAENNDKKTWKDEDDKQNIHDIQAFLRAGKIDDLRAIYNEIGQDLSDDDVESIVKATTQVISAEDDKKRHDNFVRNAILEKQKSIDYYQRQIDSVHARALELPEEERASFYRNNEEDLKKWTAAIARQEEDINAMQNPSKEYEGYKHVESPYIDENGARTKTNDEIRAEVKHNSEELQRKLDSYLESAALVNKMSGGQLTKDQEDNLTYLHNVAKEKNVRFDKIMADVRQQLPTNFLLKTNKSPEQLSQENASSNLAFAKNDTTPEGYVEADTSLMNDTNFGNFFVKNILLGGNIRQEFAETADEREAREREEQEESRLSKEEREKRAEERKKRNTAKWQESLSRAKQDLTDQSNTNIDMIISNFRDTYKQNYNASEEETLIALGDVLESIADATQLYFEAGEFRKVFNEYMENPEKVDEDKVKEEKKAEKKNKKEQVKEKFAGKTPQKINEELNDGTLTFDDLDLLNELEDEDEEIAAAKDATKKAEKTRQKQASLKSKIQEQEESEEFELVDDDIFDKVQDAVDRVAANSYDEAELDYDTILDEIEITDPEELRVASDLLAAAFEDHQADEDKKDDIPVEMPEEYEDEGEETGHDSTTKVPADTAIPQVETPQSDDKWTQPLPVNTFTSAAAEHIREELRKVSEEPATAGTWRTTTRRFGRQRGSGGRWYTTNSPYHELPDAKNPERSKAIWTYLEKAGAWDVVDNVEGDRLRTIADKNPTTIHFMVRDFTEEIFGQGKKYEDLTEEEKEQALVILMLDDNGRVLGDLPLAQAEIGYNEDASKIPSPKLRELKATQEMLFDAFLEKRKQTGCTQAVVDGSLNIDGAENLGITFKSSKRPFVSKISQILNGIVPFGKEVNTLNDVMGAKDLLLGISVTAETIATSENKSDKTGNRALPVRTGNVGQPYLLIPSSSGAYIPVPFYTAPFDAQKHQGTEFYRMLCSTLENLINDKGNNNAALYKSDMDVLQALLQVREQEGAKNTVEITRNNITLHLQSLTNADEKIDITIPNTGNNTDVARAIAEKLSGTNINVSLKFLNSKIGARGGRKFDYNRVIGEIADVNLPKNTTHTLNNGLIIQLSTAEGIKKNVVKYQQLGTRTEIIGGRTVKIDLDTFTATEVDPITKEEISVSGDEEVALALAEAKAELQADKTKPFKIAIGNELRTYNPVTKKFIKASQGVGVNAGQSSINQQKGERKEAKKEIATYINDSIKDSNIPDSGAIIRDVLAISPTLNTTQISGLIEKAFNRNSTAAKWLLENNGFRNKLISLIKKNQDEAVVTKTVTAAEKSPAQQSDNGEELELEVDEILGIVNDEEQNKVTAGKTIEDIEKEVNDAGIINRRNQDAWNAIPDALKLKMANEGAGIILEYGNTKEVLDYTNLYDMKDKLREANKYAKSGSLNVSEGAKYRKAKSEREKKADIRKEKEWLQKNLPMFSTEDRLHLIQGLIEIPGQKAWAWGRFEKGIITLSDMAARGTLYHEAFHAVTQTLLTNEELNSLYEAAVKHYKEDNVAYIEELLAEDFRKYVQRGETPIIGPILKFFRKIMNAIRNLTSYRAPIQQLFYRINNGEFRESIPSAPRKENAFYSTAKKYYQDRKDPQIAYIIRDGISRGLKTGSKDEIIGKWTRYIRHWEERGFRPVGHWDEKTHSYVINGVMLFEDFVRWEEEDMLDAIEENERIKRERYQAQQAREGRERALRWENLSPETQEALIEDGSMTERAWNQLSLDEKEQWVSCH